ncbi:MAG TPA: thioesterase family protein [Nitrospiria bacterium]|jgi:acyl-CoA thioesterase FadM|nr:thioesterase family protein [Nitrospiria bacterium]
MNLWLRFIIVLLTAFFRQALGPLDESVLTFRVWPNDLDINGHMNNGRYLTLMDLGRLDVIVRTGMGRTVLRRKWYPLVGSATIRFRFSLEPFQSYQLKSRIICWDKKWFFIEQRFERRGEIIAVGWVKGLLRGPGGNVPSSEVLHSINADIPSPEMPSAIRLWQQVYENKE